MGRHRYGYGYTVANPYIPMTRRWVCRNLLVAASHLSFYHTFVITFLLLYVLVASQSIAAALSAAERAAAIDRDATHCQQARPAAARGVSKVGAELLA
jgi:hypothetical protein